jgi:alanyl-tRNA synthetase
MTERLYYQDAYLRSFEAQVMDERKVDGHPAVVLDVTAFYPTSGGQPHDKGTLNGVQVCDVQVADDGTPVHVLEARLAGPLVVGEIDWARRFDHMQQHTGQHILSQAFLRVCQAETVSFHLGDAVSTVDLDLASLSAAQVAAAEKSANEIVLMSQEIVSRFADPRELGAMPLRKMPVVDGPIRVVQIAEYDWSPCGGTHVANSGEVGPIKAVRVERRNKVTRVYFLCGWRALDDYARKHAVVQELTGYLTTGESELLPSVQRLEARAKEASKSLADTQLQLVEYKVENWIASAKPAADVMCVALAFDDYDLVLLKEIARRVTERAGMVALLATRQPRAQLVFARSEDVHVDVSQLMRAVCANMGGRGGGRPGFAQGGIPDSDSVDAALAEAVARLGNRELEGSR